MERCDPLRRASPLQVAALCVAFGVFAILLNSVGAVILQSISYFDVSTVAAGSLEAFKDLTIAAASLTLASQLPRFGLCRSMLVALVVAGVACALVPLVRQFWAIRLMFFAAGFGFALMKVSVYALIGQLSDGSSAYARLLGIVEAAFMAAIVASAWVFAAFIDPTDGHSPAWLNVYWLMALLCAFAALLLPALRGVEGAEGVTVRSSGSMHTNLMPALRVMRSLLLGRATQVFILCVFCYVLVEQGLGSWLPTINNRVLGLDRQAAVQAASVFAMAIAIGRLVAGLLVVRLGWFTLVITCLGMTMLLLAAVPIMVQSGAGATLSLWPGIPVVAVMLPLIGFFMAPIYPTLSSVVLSAVQRDRQATLTGLIVVFSALGGVSGSQFIAIVFGRVNGAVALLGLVVPTLILTALVVWLRRRVGD